MPKVLAVIVLMGMTAIGGWFVVGAWGGGNVKQPVAYNHKAHIDAGMECPACHTGAQEGTHAGIPPTEKCALCHKPGRPYPKTPDDLAFFLKAGKEIPWTQLHRTRRHVYFSHQRHVTLAGIDCEKCHGIVKKKTTPFDRAAFPARQAGMNLCIDCHRKEKVTTDCMACHR